MNHNHSLQLYPQIIYVTGKGGVGKTTVSMMIAEALASLNRKCIVVELNNNRVIPQYYNLPSQGYQVMSLNIPYLHCISISPESAIQEYVVQQLKFQRLADLFIKNRIVSPLLQNVPGLHDAVQLGKIYALAEQDGWDHVIVDGPATGHGEVLLNAAQTLMDMIKIGPMYESNAIVDAIFRDPNRCKIVVVTLLEEMVVQETCQLVKRLRGDPVRKKQLQSIFVNRYEEKLPVLEELYKNTYDDEIEKQLEDIERHIIHHNEQVEKAFSQMKVLQKFVQEQQISQILRKIPFYSESSHQRVILQEQVLKDLVWENAR